MKFFIFVSLFFTFWAQAANQTPVESKTTLCGVVDPQNVISMKYFIMTIVDPNTNEITQKKIAATTKKSQEFIGFIGVHGGKICNPQLSAYAPASLCFTGDVKKLRAEDIYCKKVQRCRGLNCF